MSVRWVNVKSVNTYYHLLRHTGSPHTHNSIQPHTSTYTKLQKTKHRKRLKMNFMLRTCPYCIFHHTFSVLYCIQSVILWWVTIFCWSILVFSEPLSQAITVVIVSHGRRELLYNTELIALWLQFVFYCSLVIDAMVWDACAVITASAWVMSVKTAFI